MSQAVDEYLQRRFGIPAGASLPSWRQNVDPVWARPPALNAAATPTASSPKPQQPFWQRIENAVISPVASGIRGLFWGLSRPQQAVEHGVLALAQGQGLGGAVQSAWQGLTGQAPDVTGYQVEKALQQTPLAKWPWQKSPPQESDRAAHVWGFLWDLALDPLMFVSVGTLAKGLGLDKALGAAKAAIKASPAAGAYKAVSDILGAAFDKFKNTRPEFQAAWRQREGMDLRDTAAAVKQIHDIYGGAPLEVRQAATHIAERAPGWQDLAKQYPQAVPLADALRKSGEELGKALQERGLIKGTRQDYVSHILNTRFTEGGITANLSRPLRPYLSASKQRKLGQTILEINQRFATDPEFQKAILGEGGDLSRFIDPVSGQPKLFEDDAAKIHLAHLLQARRAINLHDMIQTILNAPGTIKVTGAELKKAGFKIPEGYGLYRPKTLQFFPAHMVNVESSDWSAPLEELMQNGEIRPGIAISSKTPAYLIPKAEADLLNQAYGRMPSEGERLLGKVASSPLRFARQAMLFNPFVHFPHNVLTNAFLEDPGAVNPAEWVRHIPEVYQHQMGGWYERALKAGAVSSVENPLGERFPSNIAEIVRQTVGPMDQQGSRLKRSAQMLNPYRLSALGTWIPENAMRVALFRRAVQRGATDAEAARAVNRALGNYRDLTRLEQNLARYVFPFYSWQRTAIPYALRQTVMETPRVRGIQNALNALNEATAGRPMSENPPGKTEDIATPWTDQQWGQLYLNPYLPILEPQKIGEQGLPDFAFRRLNPFLQEVVAQLTNLEDPIAAAMGQNDWRVVPYPQLQGTPYQYLNNRPLFGSFGPEVDPRIPHFLRQVLAPVGFAGELAGQTLPEILARAGGAYMSAYSPATAAKEQAYQQQQFRQQLRSALKARAKRQMPQLPPVGQQVPQLPNLP